MAAARRNFAVTALLVAVLAVAATLLPSAAWVLGLAAVLGLAGVVLLQGNRWRSGALLVSALGLGLVLVDAFAGILTPGAHGSGLVYRAEPRDWKIDHPVLGYGARPNTSVRESATYDGKMVYDVVYTIDADGRRMTPAVQAGPAPAGADTYLFFGDSFMFGSGLADGDALAAQVARVRDFRVRTANFGLTGYGPNHAVRAFEAGLVDRYADGTVRAVVTWLIPDHLRRVTGDASWLGSSPRYVLEDGAGGGTVRHTGSFTEQRWRNPVDGLLHLAGEELAFVRAIGARQREERQIELTVALLLRLQTLAREKLGAPLVVIYSWPNRRRGERVPLVERLAAAGVRTMDTLDVTDGLPVEQIQIPHDGHPSAFQIGLVAAELSRRLGGGNQR